MAYNVSSEMFWKQVISKLLNGSPTQIRVPKEFAARQERINELLDNDYTGIVKTIYEFMVMTGSVEMNYVSDNQNLTEALQDWSAHKLNANISFDIPRGLKALTTQYMRERYKSSFIVLNIIWDKINDLVLPKKMWFADGGAIIVGGSEDTLDGKQYYLGSDDNELKNTKNHTILIRKPFNAWYEGYPTQYLVSKGVLYNAMLKKTLISKQAEVIEEMIPYILALRAGDSNLMMKNLMGDVEKQLGDVKESLKQARRNKKYQHDSGDMILKGRYDLNLEHLMPDLTKLFNDSIVKPVNNDLLCGLGLVELQGFSSDRQEAILNPKVLVEEILNGVADAKALYEEVLDLIIERNAELHPKHMGQDIRIVPGVVKAFLTDAMRKLVKDHVNTGILSIEDAFEGLPQGFDFAVSKKRRQSEADNGDEDLFFPRVILNQDSNLRNDTNDPRVPTPQEVPQKKKKQIKVEEEVAFEPVITDNYIRLRQHDPKDFEKGSFKTIVLSKEKGVKAVVGNLKGKSTTTVQSYLFEKDKWTVAEAEKWVSDHKSEDMTASYEEIEAPYFRVSQLPKLVKNSLPKAAQRLWMNVFNSIYNRTGNEVRAIKGAWSVVKKHYKPTPSGKWIKR